MNDTDIPGVNELNSIIRERDRQIQRLTDVREQLENKIRRQTVIIEALTDALVTGKKS